MGPRDITLPPAARLALFLDVDGTLIDFAATPDSVVTPPDLTGALATAEQHVDGALALISGRPITELDRLVSPLRLRASGLHGLESRLTPNDPASAPQALPAGMAQDLRGLIAKFPGVALEDKGASVALHYRAAPGAAPELGDALARYISCVDAPSLDLMAGELVFEIKPAGFDKGGAISAFMREKPFMGRQPVFVSDHPIDQAGFDTAASLGGFGLSVGRRLAGTAGWFPDTQAVRAWLGAIA